MCFFGRWPLSLRDSGLHAGLGHKSKAPKQVDSLEMSLCLDGHYPRVDSVDSCNSDAITMAFVWTAEQLKEHIALDSHEYYECFQGQRAGQLQPHGRAVAEPTPHT